MARAHVGPKGQVVVPKEFRDLLHIHPGDTVVFEARGEKLMLTPVAHRTARDLRGALKVGHPIDLEHARRSRQDDLVAKALAEPLDHD